MERYELQKLRDLPIEEVAERLGLRVTRHKALCPFHDDHHASLSFHRSKNTFRCFVCDAHGGTIDLVMRCLRVDFAEACRWLAGTAALPFREPPPPRKEKPFDASRYERFFLRPWLSEAARQFLFAERRLSPKVVEWCRLTSWRDLQGIDWLQIPYYDQQGHLIGIQNRRLTKTEEEIAKASTPKAPQEEPHQSKPPKEEGPHQSKPPYAGGLGGPRFRFPSGSRCGIYNLPILGLLREGDELWITEGCSDCWAMLSSGRKAIAIPSATLLTWRDKELLKGLSPQPKFHMYPDSDLPGERLFLALKAILPTLVHHQLPKGVKDYGEYFGLAKPKQVICEQ